MISTFDHESETVVSRISVKRTTRYTFIAKGPVTRDADGTFRCGSAKLMPVAEEQLPLSQEDVLRVARAERDLFRAEDSARKTELAAHERRWADEALRIRVSREKEQKDGTFKPAMTGGFHTDVAVYEIGTREELDRGYRLEGAAFGTRQIEVMVAGGLERRVVRARPEILDRLDRQHARYLPISQIADYRGPGARGASYA